MPRIDFKVVDGDDRVEIKVPYDEDFIEGVKDRIGPGHRAWDGERRVWSFCLHVIGEVHEVLYEAFGRIPPGLKALAELEEAKARQEEEAAQRREDAANFYRAQREAQEAQRRAEQQERVKEQRRAYARAAGAWATPPPPSPGKKLKIDQHHQALWIIPGAPLEVIKAAYRALALMHHPDVGGDQERMKAINVAFETITAKRKTG